MPIAFETVSLRSGARTNTAVRDLAVVVARPTWMSRRIHRSKSVDRQTFNSEKEHGVSPEESQWLVRVRSVQVSVDRLRGPVRADRGRRLCRLSHLVLTPPAEFFRHDRLGRYTSRNEALPARGVSRWPISKSPSSVRNLISAVLTTGTWSLSAPVPRAWRPA